MMFVRPTCVTSSPLIGLHRHVIYTMVSSVSEVVNNNIMFTYPYYPYCHSS